MPNDFNADDIFEMAVKIEQNGAIFYRQAADKVDGEENKAFLLDLAKMEDDHEQQLHLLQTRLRCSCVFNYGFSV